MSFFYGAAKKKVENPKEVYNCWTGEESNDIIIQSNNDNSIDPINLSHALGNIDNKWILKSLSMETIAFLGSIDGVKALLAEAENRPGGEIMWKEEMTTVRKTLASLAPSISMDAGTSFSSPTTERRASSTPATGCRRRSGGAPRRSPLNSPPSASRTTDFVDLSGGTGKATAGPMETDSPEWKRQRATGNEPKRFEIEFTLYGLAAAKGKLSAQDNRKAEQIIEEVSTKVLDGYNASASPVSALEQSIELLFLSTTSRQLKGIRVIQFSILEKIVEAHKGHFRGFSEKEFVCVQRAYDKIFTLQANAQYPGDKPCPSKPRSKCALLFDNGRV